MFLRHVPELCAGGNTPSGLPVQVQLLGGHPGRMAEAAAVACQAGAKAIDINFGCPAPTVNRHDGGATLLKHPGRIREIVRAVRAAVPPDVPVSAKLRLGWDTTDPIFENAEMAAEGGANWLTIHGRTRLQGYAPPAHWAPIGIVRKSLSIPVVANGDIWTVDDFRRCRDETGCRHFMLGRGALADPRLPRRVAQEMGLLPPETKWDMEAEAQDCEWIPRLERLIFLTQRLEPKPARFLVCRLKQWLNIAGVHGAFTAFELIKRAETPEELLAILAHSCLLNL